MLHNNNFRLICLLASCMLVMWVKAASDNVEKKETILPMYAVHFLQGHRHTMEDFVSARRRRNGYALFGVYDGHGGAEVASILAGGDGAKEIRSLSTDILNGIKASHGTDVAHVLKKVFVQKDKIFKEYSNQGSTAVVALLNMSNKDIYLAWAGDSRAIVVDEDDKIILATTDHKPQDLAEQKRIKAAGGEVIWRMGTYRVNGDLSTSRAFADFRHKPYDDKPNPITAEPDVVTLNLQNQKPKYLVLASDGVWDVFDNEALVKYIRNEMALRSIPASCSHDKEPSSEELLQFLAHQICYGALKKGSKDNTTALVVDLTSMDQ